MMLFDLAGVGFRYQDVVAIRSLTLQVADGTRVALVGANGSGKSTCLRLLDALYFPDSGTVRFRGEALTEAAFADEGFSRAFRRRVGLVFQNPDVQLFNPTVFDEVAFGPLQLGWAKDEVRARVEDTMARMRLSDLRHRAPQRLSGGEKKRVALASVLVMDPEVLLLDEPTAALDPRSRSEIIDLLVGWGDGSKSVITATHDLEALEEIADRCCVLHGGELVADAAPADILGDTALLDRTNLIHVHRHRHGSQLHVHPHVHGHHEHTESTRSMQSTKSTKSV
jgi:cobalt/nickel transport system ATP-binding protein